MKAIKGICWFVVLGLLALPAVAGTVVNMQFTGLPTGANYWGVASYPYNVSVNNGPNQWMMCIGYNEHIETGEIWQANVRTVGSLDPNTNALYYQAAFLFEMARADHGADPNVNAATWYLLEGVPGLTPEAQAEIAKACKREVKEGKRVLFPVLLVGFGRLRDWECVDSDTGKDSAREIREYFIPDVSNWKEHDSYQAAFGQLVGHLNAEAST